MHIGLVLYGSLNKLSGGYLYDRKLVAYLQERGDSVEIISLPWRNYLCHLHDNFSNSLFRRLVRLRADVLLQDELNYPSFFMLNRRLREQIDYPIISIVHLLGSCESHLALQNYFYRRVERLYLSNVNGFIYNSLTTRQAAEQLLMNCDVQKRPSVVAFPGGDRLHPEISAAEITRRAQRDILQVLFLGNVIPRKGLHILLKALKQLSTDQWKLTVIGDTRVEPSYFRAINHQITQDGLAKNVSFVGIVSDGELVNYMKTSHLLVMPSSYEGYGIVYSECMGFGLPAIGTNQGAAWEIITHNREGFLISPGDVIALTSYLTELAQNRQYLLEMSLAAYNRYRSLPTWEECTKTIRTFLIQLTQGVAFDTA
jgi:glycosyltransferase involved in cell wall biosynthesis